MNWKKLTDFPFKKGKKGIKKGEKQGVKYWKILHNKVWHQHKKLTSADLDSFEIFEEEYYEFFGRDKDNIYHAWNKLPKVDRETFEKAEGPYWKDKSYIYFEYETSLRPLKGLDAKSFKYLGNGFAFDKNYAYNYGVYIRACKKPATLEIVKGDKYKSFVKDEDNIYFGGASLKGVDRDSWIPIDDTYSRDKKSVFFHEDKLPRVDINTWEYLGGCYSKDKNRVYHMSWVEKNENPEDWDKERVIKEYTT